jgi:hypothetical protein
MQEIKSIRKQIKKSGNEPIQSEGSPGATILDYWRWAHSDVLGNTERGVFAEFLVGLALGLNEGIRTEWEKYDLNYNGKKIEVKSSAYLQTWTIDKHSRILFSIGAKRHWDIESRKYSEEAMRHADIYVFCLLECRDQGKVNPLDTNQWCFYVMTTQEIEKGFSKAASLSLERLIQAQAKKTNFEGLKRTIDEIGAA